MISLLPASGGALQEAKDIEAMRGYALGEIERARQADQSFNFPASGFTPLNAPPIQVTLNDTIFNEWVTLGTVDDHPPYALHLISIKMQRADGKGIPVILTTRQVVVK